MGEELVSSYLRSKFLSILEEAEADSGGQSLIMSRFQSMAAQIKKESTDEACSIPVDHLFCLNEALSDFRVFTYKSRTPRKGFYLPALIKLHHLVSDFIFKRRMTKLLHAIEKKLQSHRSSRPAGPPIKQERYDPFPHSSSIIGFDAQVETIEACLMTTNQLPLIGIGIAGRCGCGKTALAQKVFDSPEFWREFSPRIWVCLSNMLVDNDDRRRLLRSMLYNTKSNSTVEMLTELRSRLMGKRYLIVLDDVWQADEWYADLSRDSDSAESLSYGLPKGSGGAVIVTSRKEDVIERMVGDKHVMRLEELSDDICWQIFSQAVQIKKELLSKIEDDAKRMFNGLPLAARIIAHVLNPPKSRMLGEVEAGRRRRGY